MQQKDDPCTFYPFRKAILAKRFNRGKRPLWFEKIRAHLLGQRIKLLVHCGFGVVIVGGPGAGKTFILESAMPGKIVQPERNLFSRTPRQPLDVAQLPNGICAVDESAKYDWEKTRASFPSLRERKVVLTVQSVGQILELGLNHLFANRLLIVFIGTRDELREECRKMPFFFSQSALGLKMPPLRHLPLPQPKRLDPHNRS